MEEPLDESGNLGETSLTNPSWLHTVPMVRACSFPIFHFETEKRGSLTGSINEPDTPHLDLLLDRSLHSSPTFPMYAICTAPTERGSEQ